jgi:hypothetical protein
MYLKDVQLEAFCPVVVSSVFGFSGNGIDVLVIPNLLVVKEKKEVSY